MGLIPTVIFTFDDVRSDVVPDALPVLRDAGVVATTYVAPVMDLTWQEIIDESVLVARTDALYAAGWDVANHTLNHPLTNAVTPSEYAADAALCDDWLVGKGYERGRKHFCYPGGYTDVDHTRAIIDAGFVTARATTEWYVDAATNLAMMWCRRLDPEHTLATSRGFVDTAKAAGQCVVFYSHHVDGPADGGVVKFAELVAYIQSVGVRILSTSQWYDALQTEMPPTYGIVRPSQVTIGASTYYYPQSTAQLLADHPTSATELNNQINSMPRHSGQFVLPWTTPTATSP